MIKKRDSYGDHGEIFAAVLFDKFLLKEIKKSKKVFSFLNKDLLLDRWCEQKTKAGGKQLTDLRFELVFHDSSGDPFCCNIFIESKTYLSNTSSDKSLMESASKMNDELRKSSDRFSMGNIGSSYCVFRPGEVSVNQDVHDRLNGLLLNEFFPETRFQVCSNELGVNNESLIEIFKEFEKIPGIMSTKSIRKRIEVSKEADIVCKLVEIIENAIVGGCINVSNITPILIDGIRQQIKGYLSSNKRYGEIIKHLLNGGGSVGGFPDNTDIGFDFVGGDFSLYKKDLDRAKNSHREFWIRKQTLIDHPLVSEEINLMLNDIEKSRTDIYEVIELSLSKAEKLHPTIGGVMGRYLTTHRIKEYLFENVEKEKGLFFEWGSSEAHKLIYEGGTISLSI